MSHIRHAVRSLLNSPALATVAIVSLALGIGANVTVFSIVREMLLDDVSAWRPDRLARVEGVDVPYAMYRELRAAGAFQGLAFHRGFGDRIWRTGSRSEVVWRLTTSANFFDVLGVRAYAGRLYSQADEGRALAVASYGFWRKRLHGDRNAIGHPIRLEDQLYTLAGILPPDYRSIYRHGVSPELYLSDPGDMGHDRFRGLFGRLPDGASFEQTRQSLAAAIERLRGPEAARQIVALDPISGWRASASKPGDDRLFFLFFVMLFFVAGMLALIGCSNVAGLLVIRIRNRQRELAIRKALGASRLQIAAPLLAEGLVLVLCGAGLGLVLDLVLRNRLSYLRWPTAYNIPLEFHFQSDSGLFIYASLTALAALLLSSVLPALRGADADLNLAIKQGEPAFSIRRWDMRSGFVVLQVVLSMVLLTLSSVFLRGLWHVTATGPGFDITHTLIAAMHTLPGRYPGEREWDLRQQAIARVKSVPGVVAATSTGLLPLMGEVPYAMLRRAGESLSAARRVYVMESGENYFETLNIPILRGRDFAVSDRGRHPIPAIINRTLARDLLGGADPIGQHLLRGPDTEEVLEIVGIAADSKMRTLFESNMPALFEPDFNGQLLVRVAGTPSSWIEPLRHALEGVDRTAALDVRPLEEAAAGALFPMRVATAFLAALSGLGLVLSLIGLYGSVSYSVGRRTREFGIRSALGGGRCRIVWSALRDGTAALLCGIALGAPLAFCAIRPLVELLPAGLNPWAPIPFLGVILLLAGTGAAAAWIPARRAARIDPSKALRQD
ncbi:MAG: FtsX-like permease family protein [Bryobacteraceae bacterium]